MKFNTLGNRIGLGYALMATVLAVAVLATLWQVNDVTRTSDRIRELRVPTAHASLAMLNSIHESNGALRGWTILGEASLKERRSRLWSDEIEPLLKEMTTLSEKWTDPNNVKRLSVIRQRLAQLARFQRQVEHIAQTPENEPATKLLLEEAMPCVRVVNESITAMIEIEKVQETTGDRKRLLGEIANLSASTPLAISDLHAYLRSGDEALQRSFDKHWRASAAQLARVVSYRRWLTLEQREALTRLSAARQKLDSLTFRAIEIRRGEQWNHARWLLATEAIPTADEIQFHLEAMVASQQRLMAGDIVDSQYQITRLWQTEWGLVVFGLGICVLLAIVISRSAIRPIRHAVDVANRIAAGKFDSHINIAGSIEAKSLGTALSTMMASLSTAAQVNEDRVWLATGRQKLSDAVRGNADVATISQNIVKQLTRHLGCRGAILYVTTDEHALRATASFGLVPQNQSDRECEFCKALAERAVLDGQRIIVSDAPKDCVCVASCSGGIMIENVIIAPILYGGMVKAVIALGAPSKLSERQLRFLDEIAEDVAIAIDSAQNREQIRNSQQRIKAIVDTAVDSIITITGDGRIESFNPAAERLFGYSEKEMLGENIKMLMPSPYREEHDGYLRRYASSGKASIIGISREVVGQRSDGTTFPLSLSVSQLVIGDDGDGASLLFTGVLRDLSEQKRMESELVAREAAVAANDAKSEFLANMSHEIRTPMTAILGFSEVVLGNVSDPQNIEGLKTIQRNGRHLLRIINDILDISKIESGKLKVEHIECSPCQILADVASLMHVRASGKGLALKLECDGPIPQHIHSDPTRLRQILINLIGNAIKFTEVGTIRVVARLVHTGAADPQMQFGVVDTGIGMTQQQMDNLFQPFVQADTSTTRKFGGTGLGLTISKRLANMLGGSIHVQSVSGEGSTFSATVSTGSLEGVMMVTSPSETEATAEPVAKSTAADARLDCRILLAEDGPDNQRLISFLLKKAGAEVAVAENGQIALDLALEARDQSVPFDVILMDMQMPVLDGYEATGKLREAGYTGPIIALTAHAMSSDRDKCLAAGCDDYMSKPVDRKQLVSMVAQYVSKQAPA